MKAITFLGTGRYKETTYCYNDENAPVTDVFPVALCHFFKPDEILVLVTKDAEKMWLEKFENQCAEKLGKCPVVTPIKIPDGHSVADLWEIFGELTRNLNEKDEVIFDITHSFRTLPFLSFLAASFLRVAKSVDIKGIYYGAWEARNPPPPSENPFDSKPTDKSPIFDLTPFLELLSWTTATDQFIKTGNAESLSKLIRSSNITGGINVENLAQTVNKIALGLNTLRPFYVMEESANLSENIKNAAPEIEKDLPQLTPLLERIEKDYSQFALKTPKDADKQKIKKRLTNQLRMVGWYERRERWIQALSLARESIVSLVCVLLEKNDLSDNDRTRVGKLLNKHYTAEKKVPYRKDWENALSENLRESLHKFWGGEANRIHFGLADSQADLANLRNDVMHAGIGENSIPIEETIRKSKEILKEFKKVVGEILKS